MLVIEKPTIDSILASTMESGLGLDISKRSTGITIYYNGKYETCQSIIEFDEESPLHLYYMVKALEDDLLYLAEGRHFDIIAIEDTIESVNYETLRSLILLNSVIDRLIAEGKITCNYFSRISNSTWKKWLRTLRPNTKKYENDKAETEHTLADLGHPLVEECKSMTKTQKEKIGYQDQLDSTGVLIGAGLDRQNSGLTNRKKKKRYKLHVELYGSIEEISKKYNLSDLNRINLGGNLLRSVKNFFKELDEEHKLKKFYLHVNSLGTLGIEYDMSDLEGGENHLILYQTEI